MVRVVILYPKTADSHFDMNYYLKTHITHIREIFKDLGLVKIEIDEGVASAMPGQPIPYASISYFTFKDPDGFQKGFATSGAWIMGDIANYTNVQPLIQIDRIVVTE